MMNRYKLFMAGINTNEGIKRFSGNVEIYEKYLFRFPEDKNYDALCEAIRNSDVKAAFAAGHALKGVAGNLSLEKLYEDVVPLVEELRANRLEQASALLEPVAADYAQVIAALQEEKA